VPSDTAKRLGAVAAIATAIAIPAEGLRQWAYYDPPGILTVCYGHTGSGVVRNVKYSLADCKVLLTEDMMEAVNAVEKCHPNLPENVHAAFADAVFNIGPKVACNSTASKYLALGDYEAACKELPRWNKTTIAGVLVPLPGLTKRRNAEMQLCLA
jgi:GH24 family phage-related lysozyme (muramidase)